MTGPVARVVAVLYNRSVAIADEWPWPVLDALDAAAEQASQLHLDLCDVYDGRPCSCGVPGMLVQVRDRVFAQAGERVADRASEAQQAA